MRGAPKRRRCRHSASFASDAQHQLAHAEQQEKTAANKKLADGLAHGERLFAEAMSAEVREISRIRKLEVKILPVKLFAE